MNTIATPWTAIADIAGQVNKTAQDFLKEKIEKDAAAIANIAEQAKKGNFL